MIKNRGSEKLRGTNSEATTRRFSFLVASFSKVMKIVVQHTRMTDQAHLFASRSRIGSNECATPGAHNLKPGIVLGEINIVTQNYLPTDLIV